MATIKKKAQAGTTIKKPAKAPRDISDSDFKKYGWTESQLEGRRKIKVEEQKNTPNAFVDYKAIAAKKQIAQKKNGGNIKKASCAKCGKSVKKGKK